MIVEVLLVPAIAWFLWWSVINMFRELETRRLLDDLRADPRDVAQAEDDLGVRVLAGWEGEG